MARRDSAPLNLVSTDQTLWKFLASLVSIYFMLALGIGALAAVGYLFVLIWPGFLAWWLASRHLSRKAENEDPESRKKEKQGYVMLSPGYVSGSGRVLGLSTATSLNYVVSALVTELVTTRMTLPSMIKFILPVFHVFTIGFVVLSIFAASRGRLPIEIQEDR
jgi:Ca2+/Na+ antiporter